MNRTLKVNKEHLKRANEYARKNDYTSAIYRNRFKDFDVFELSISDNEILMVGYPIFLLVSDKVERLSTPDETYKIIGITFVSNDKTETLD